MTWGSVSAAARLWLDRSGPNFAMRVRIFFLSMVFGMAAACASRAAESGAEPKAQDEKTVEVAQELQGTTAKKEKTFTPLTEGTQPPDSQADPATPTPNSGDAIDRAAAATAAAAVAASHRAVQASQLPVEGNPGDVRLVCMRTDVIQRSRWIVPKVPVPPFNNWNRWLDEHPQVAHCALDWMDNDGQWWHAELRGFDQYPDKYRVGQGEFRASGVTIYGVFILPGRSDPEGQKVHLDELLSGLDYRVIEREARRYGRLDKRRGDPGTGGDGSRNVGLGGPAWRPTCNSNTFISHLLRKAGLEREAPPEAIGWETVPTFPYSSDADAYPE